MLNGIAGGGAEQTVRRRVGTVNSRSSTELTPGVLKALSMAVSSWSSGGGEKDQTCGLD